MAPPKKWSPVTKTCSACRQPFEATTSYAITKQLYCSRECSLPAVNAAKRVPRLKRKCEQCGEVVKRVPSHFENREHVFCSNECRARWRSESGEFHGEGNPQWEGGSSKWWKQKARERDDFTCQFDECSIRDEGRGTHAHHKVPKMAGGIDSLDNLITFCDHHHQVMEAKLIKLVFEHLGGALLQRVVDDLYEEYEEWTR